MKLARPAACRANEWVAPLLSALLMPASACGCVCRVGNSLQSSREKWDGWLAPWRFLYIQCKVAASPVACFSVTSGCFCAINFK